MTWKYYTKEGIKEIPNTSGVYCIQTQGSGWIYVGESGTMRDRVTEHYDGDSDQSGCINSNDPYWVGYDEMGYSERKKKEQELIKKHNPKCNK